MAAFVHCHDDGGRFNDGRLGAWYAALDVATAIEETAYHLTRRLSLSEGGFPQSMQIRQLITRVDAALLDVRSTQTTHPEFYHLDDCGGSQAFAGSIRWPFIEDGEAGLIYDSVRNDGGVNVCVFKPDALARPVIQGDHYQYGWDVKGRIHVDRLTSIKSP